MKNKEPIRILQCVNIMDRAGLETMLMNYYRNIDRSKVQFDFLVHRNNEGAYDKEIKALGGNVFHAPRLMPQNYRKYTRYMNGFFEEHVNYEIVHSHIDAMSYFPLKMAKKSDVAIRIAHSHTSKLDRDFKYPIKQYARRHINDVANVRFACSEKAGKFLFGNGDFKIINNAIDLEQFKYSKIKREKKREELGIKGDAFVVGHVGRYMYIKNQMFLVDVFAEIKKKIPNSLLLLIGDGPDLQKIRKKVATFNIADSVLFLQDRDDVADLYQTMDIFVMPSLFEGFPVVGVEAQANGLPCVFSDNITDDIKINNNVEFLSLNDGVEWWAERIRIIRRERCAEATENVKMAGFDIKKESGLLQEYYMRCLK